MNESSKKWFATTVAETVYPADRSRPSFKADRLVLIEAENADDARRESALLEAAFHEATEEEWERWQDTCMEDLRRGELWRLERLVRADSIALVSKRLREQQLGSSGERVERNLGKAIRLAVLRSKLTLLIDEMLGDDEDEAEEAA